MYPPRATALLSFLNGSIFRTGLLLSCLAAVGCVAGADSAATDEDSEEVDAVDTSLTAAESQAQESMTLRCMQKFATATYDSVAATPASICHTTLNTVYSSDVLKVYETTSSATGEIKIVLAFAGTRVANAGDDILDLASQVLVNHTSVLSSDVTLNMVGLGWNTRWLNQAKLVHSSGKTLVKYLNDRVAFSKTSAVYKKLTVVTVGHSLGGVTAQLAGYDIAKWLAKQSDVQQKVWTVSLDAPRLGNGAARTEYDAALIDSGTWGTKKGAIAFKLTQLTRQLDTIQSLPFFMTPPVWQTAANNKTIGVGTYAGTGLSYCPQYHAPTALNPHSLAKWTEQINAIPAAHLHCMFGENAGTFFLKE